MSVIEDTVHAFCRDNPAALAPTGDGALDGLRFAAKDVFEIAGTRTGFGQPDWLASHPPARANADAIDRLLGAGAELVGRTISDELCYSLTGDNVHYGAPVNSWGLDRLSGGSSSGSAAATCAGLVDFALGTDCGGSVRVPASYCGLLGLRTTHGRVPTDGLLRFANAFDCIGWFARDAEIFERVARVLLPEAREHGPFKRVLIATDAFEAVDDEIAEAFAPALETLAAEVGEVGEVRLSEDGLDRWFETFRIIQAADVWSALGDWVTRTRPALGPGVCERIEQAAHIDEVELRAAQAHRAEITVRLDSLIGEDDVVVLPSTPRPAPPRGGGDAALETTYRFQAMSLLCSAGLAGLPQMSLPLAMKEGLPLGLSIMTRRNGDMRLIELAGRVCPRVPVPPEMALA
ncbi:amidase [Salinisphaera orenii MK-B5]|uniref:Amidase n=2 Tax=Salinisphaera TaxID=180541 RepID=A0A423PMZ7_9GAMM|nr:amidase [Salinisphaera orenii MK-B5]